MASLASPGVGRAGSLGAAKALSLLVPAALLAGGYGFEHIRRLFSCEVCWWQRLARHRNIVDRNGSIGNRNGRGGSLTADGKQKINSKK